MIVDVVDVEGFESGFVAGREEGWAEGFEAGYTKGHNVGWKAAMKVMETTLLEEFK